MNKSEVVKEIALATGIEVLDVGDLLGLPDRKINMEKLKEINNNFLATLDKLPPLDTPPDSVLLTSEDARNYERACVEEVQNKAGTKK